MKSPYERPWPVLLFYILAGLVFIGYLLFGLVFAAGGAGLGGGKGTAGLFIGAGLSSVFIGLVASSFIAAIGYVIELIAKIEWNTRPDEGSGLSYLPPIATAPLPTKRYFYIANGPLHGPFQAPEILELYRSGKVPNNARLYVEEGGNRRPLANWSEIGV